MNKMLNLLVCPSCKGKLFVKNKSLDCKKCKNKYEIKEGIPVLIDLNNLPEHLQGQIKYFEKVFLPQDSKYKIDVWEQNYINRFLNNFKKLKNKLIVDCGTGSGYMSLELVRLGVKVIAYDLTFQSLVRLKKIIKKLKLEDRILLICCSAEELPFKDNIVDYYIANHVLEHLPKEKQSIQEINRVCKKGAGFMIAGPLSYKYLLPIFWPINYIHDKRINHLRRYDEKILVNKLKNWKLIQTYYSGYFRKVVKLFTNIVVKIFDEEKMEKEDIKNPSRRYGASNIICFFIKK